MKILVINAGSSSLKYQLIDMENESLLAKGLCERIGIDGRLQHKPQNGKPVFEAEMNFPTHQEAIEAVLEKLVSKEYGVVESMSEIGAVGHRVLHGGNEFTKSCLVDDACEEAIKKCFPLGPLHNPANLMGIEACEAVMPGTPMVAVFDTAFHQTMPEQAYTYALPYDMYKKYGIRRYGAHGTSHRFVSAEMCKILGRVEGTKIVTCHIGNGSSISAVKDGKVIDTSMGFTPLAGVMMGTRCGDIDPAIVPYIMKKEGFTPDEMSDFMNKQCGFLGVSGISSDSRDIEAAILEGNKRAYLTATTLAYQVKKFIGAYAAAMNGLDAVVFTAGMGENNPELRERACTDMEFYGIEIDKEVNAKAHHQPNIVELSTKNSRVKVYLIPTNEELVIAQDTDKIVSAL